jgi:hypothetical protein
MDSLTSHGKKKNEAVAPVGTVQSIVNLRSLTRAFVTLLPFFIVYTATGDPRWLSASIVTISLVIAIERVGLVTAGTLLQGSAILGVFLLLSSALSRPGAFVAACALVGAFAIVITAWGERLRTVGNFIFIPALYLTCEGAETHMVALELLPYLAAGVITPLLLSMVGNYQRRHLSVPGFWRGWIRLGERPWGRAIPSRQILEASFVVVLAVGSMAFVVQWWHWGNGQWAIWSAASVVTGDAVSTHRKLVDRVAGVLLGVPAGLMVAMVLPHGVFWYTIASLSAFLTLVSFRRYIVAFGARCACIACAGWVASGAADIAVDRVINVIVGGLVGVAFAFLVRRMTRFAPLEP